MRLATVTAFVLALATVVCGQVVPCPLLAARLSTSPKGRSAAGKTVTVTARISKTFKKAALGRGGVAINVPPDTCVLAAKPSHVRISPESGNVFWPNVTYNKMGLATFRMKVRFPSYYNASTASFSAYAYIPERGCATTAAPLEVCTCEFECACTRVASFRYGLGLGEEKKSSYGLY